MSDSMVDSTRHCVVCGRAIATDEPALETGIAEWVLCQDCAAERMGEKWQAALVKQAANRTMSAAELKARREALGLNGAQLAALLGVSGAAVTLWEQGKNKVPRWAVLSFERLEKLHELGADGIAG